MALIDQLTGDGDSLVGRALSLRDGTPPAAPDTTDAAAPSESVEAAPPPPAAARDHDVDPGAAVRALLKELQVQRSFGITSPSHLFSLLHRHLQVRRGALLVPAPEDEFLPIATAGIDRTSALRLRFTGDEIGELVQGQRVAILSGAQRERLADRMSRSDFRRTPRVALFPFFHLNRLLAILVVFGSPILEFDPSVLNVIIGALSDSAGRLLFDGRQKPLGYRQRSVVLHQNQAADAAERLLAGARSDTTPHALRLDITALVDLVLQVHPHLDQDRLLEDMIDTIALLVADSHSVVHSGRGILLLLGYTRATMDSELLVHLIGTTVAQLFGVGQPTQLEFSDVAIDDIRRDA